MLVSELLHWACLLFLGMVLTLLTFVSAYHQQIIPKTESEGLGIGWKSLPTDHGKFATLAEDLRKKIEAQ
jgi:hypothetical protein